jgi:hypothetical protein
METKMKQNAFAARAVKLAGFALLGAAVLVVMGCFYMPGLAGRGGTARASIAVSKALPTSGIASVVLVVGGPGMDTIANTYTVGTTTATLTVPSGPARTFTILANTPSVTFRDDVTVDLAPGETKSITLNPVLATSQIIIPDNLNARFVQISDMRGTGWTQLATGASASAYDVDFDNQGKIYVANDSSPGIFLINDISDTSVTALTGVTGTYIRSIAMDRTHGLLYYTDGSSLWRIQVTPTPGSQQLVDLASQNVFVSTKGIAVDSDGFVYIANNYSTPEILKINPNPITSPSVVASYSGALDYPYDVLVKGDYIYISDPKGLKIVRLSKGDLKLVDSFSGPDSDHPFLGPERFVAILNKPITVVDQNGYPVYGTRLVSFGDMTGAGWTEYGSYGTGQDQFKFYNGYQY